MNYTHPSVPPVDVRSLAADAVEKVSAVFRSRGMQNAMGIRQARKAARSAPKPAAPATAAPATAPATAAPVAAPAGPGWMQQSSDWISQNPGTAAGIAGAGAVGLGTAGYLAGRGSGRRSTPNIYVNS